ncbi:hypothetical protein COHA_007147 [Chlorella ohadii]|uniref:Uncharacterized protein n=1 Tax=Chlorella ohadii TaxID=2649997 RepID=A0AAD5DRI2_9CHLO|nr:hypothetical protein COHA_007147 [Chlorella ohadii]
MGTQTDVQPSPSTLKERGNELFKAGKHKEAVEAYTAALEAGPEDAALYSNRAAARIKLGDAAAALEDAEAAVRLRPDWDKGHYRRGCALEMQGQLEQALRAFDSALKLSPDSRDVSDRVRNLKRRLGQRQRESQQAQQAQQASGRGQAGTGPMPMRMPAGPPAPDAWAHGLSTEQRYEWLCDCYRMRVDDDYAWGGGNLHGLYAPDASGDSVAEDFLVFCKMAVANGVVPPGWDWARFLQVSAGLLPYAFEKSDAKEKWGGENVFAAMMGGRSLRATAEVVLGSSCMHGAEPDTAALEVQERLFDQIDGRLGQLLGSGASAQQKQEAAELLADVGGPAAWRTLLQAVRHSVRDAFASGVHF